MSDIYNSNGIYPSVKTNVNNWRTTETYTVPAELANNPAKILLAIYGNLSNGSLLWLINKIRNPYKELVAGKVLILPALQSVSSSAIKTNASPTTIKVKTGKTSTGNKKLVY